MDHYKGINENERYNNDLLNEIRKTNQLLERLISNKSEPKKETKPRSDKRATSRQQQVRSISRNAK